MARENQGLQIALIVFVMLTLILGVTTFMFYRQSDEAKNKAAAAEKAESDAKQALTAAQTDNANLKRYLGFGATETMQVIGQEVLKDMQVTASSLPAADQNYHKVVHHLNDTVLKKNQALALAEAEKAQMKKERDDRERDAATRIAQHEEEVKKTGADLATVTASFKQTADGLNSEKDKLLNERKEIEDKGNKKINELQANLGDQTKKTNTAQIIAEQYRKQKEALEHTTFEIAYGKIVGVNQRTGRVFVNLGEADGLRRLMTFGVFTSATDDVSQAEKKASIEVVEILGPHMCEARITDDKPGNPIAKGDLVFTPIWAPGKRIHFALAGLIDLDRDGKSDLERVRSIIATNGAVVDAYQDTAGVVHGKITTETNYLVRGTPPDETSAREMRRGYTRMLDDAKDNLVKEIQLGDLFDRMGYRDSEHVTRYGTGANPVDFRAQAPPEGMKKSDGTVSPLFQPRQPSRGTGTRSAY